MKRIPALLFIIFVLSAAAFSQSVQEEFLGRWRLVPGTIEQEDGLLVSPDAVYAFPYLGVTELDFLDSGFVVFSVLDTEYRAFYDIAVLDFDNYHFTCTFKEGEVFLLKLVRTGEGGWRFLYRIPEDSVLKLTEDGEESDSEDGPDGEPTKKEAESDEAEIMQEDMDAEPLYSLFTGVMERIK